MPLLPLKTLLSKAIIAAAITTASLAIPSAIANDSTAELATGGLVFTKTHAIVMRAEQLFISTTEIRVRYVFFSKSDKDISNTVAFPMPDITFDDSLNIAIPTDDPQNLLGFSTKAAGQSVNSRVEQKVFANGIDRTALLRQFRIPLAPHLETTRSALDGMSRKEWANLINLGLAAIEEYSTGLYPNAVMNEHLSPRWTLKTTYFWQQTFPAQRELVIEHRYKPSLGGSAQTMLGNTDAAIEDVTNYRRKFCTDSDFIDTATQGRRTAHSTYAPFVERRIEYILTTGANWAGPIGDFTLVIDKGKSTNLVSFCATGVKKISPTQFEVRKTNFVPSSDLSILILEPPK